MAHTTPYSGFLNRFGIFRSEVFMEHSKINSLNIYILNRPGHAAMHPVTGKRVEPVHFVMIIEEELFKALASVVGFSDGYEKHMISMSRFSGDHNVSLDDLRLYRLGDSIDSQMMHIFAESFVNSLDMIFRWIRLSDKTISGMNDFLLKYAAIMEIVKDIRDSIAHSDERNRGLGKNKKPITDQLQIHGNLRGDILQITTADKIVRELPINLQIFNMVCSIVEEYFRLYKWEGMKAKAWWCC